MADYYPLLSRAISGLPTKTGEARGVVYERARKALLAQLRGAEPPLRDEDIARERGSLEDAIRRIEAEHGVIIPEPEPAPVAPEPTPPEDDYLDIPEPAPRASQPWMEEAASATRGRSNGDFSALRPMEDSTDDASDAALAGERHPPGFDDEATSRRGKGPLIAFLIFLVLVIGGGAVGYTQREAILALVGGAKTPATQTGTTAASRPAVPEVSKSSDRIAQAPTDSAAPRSTSTPVATPGAAGVPVAQSAVLFEESAGGGNQGLQQFRGTVVWSTENFQPGNGLAPDIGIRAQVTIPDRNVKVTLRLRRNQDASIPASHIIEAQFELPPNFDLGTVATVPGMRAKASEGAQGAPLTGLAVRVAPGYFLIGLSAIEQEKQRNLGMLITRNWLDLPMVFENGRRAILALEKGVPGDQAFRQVFSAWGLPLPPQTAPANQ